MATTFKLIKKKEFDTNGTKGIAITVAFKGRAMNISTLSFADEPVDTVKIDEKAGTVVVSCDIEVIKAPYVNGIGEVVQGLTVMPKFGLAIADI